MINWIKENGIAFVIVLICHVILLVLLLVNWKMEQVQQIVFQQGDIVQVTAIDANSYQAEIDKIEQKKAAEKRQAEALKQKKITDEKKRKAARKKAQQEKKRKKEAQKKRKAEEKHKQEQLKQKQLKKERLKKERLKEEQLKKAQLKKEQLKKEQQKKTREAEKKRTAEAKRKAEVKRKAEAQRQTELKRQAEQEKETRERLSKGIVNRHVALITDKIKSNWRQPLGTPAGLQCRIDIVLLADGQVVSVEIFESSGNPAFDHSVKNAVRKSEPLPVPTDSVIFKKFEKLRLRFNPGSY